MPTNPYENPNFAREYVLGEVDKSKNRYEWDVTYPASLQFIDGSVKRILDYGCGSGIFTAGYDNYAKQNFNAAVETTGTDASPEMLRYSELIASKVPGIMFEQWDAGIDKPPFETRSFDRIFAKLVLNYVSKEDLHGTVMPRLRESLTDEGLLVAILPNPWREVAYSQSSYEATTEIKIDVGNFDLGSTTSYRHTYEEMIEAANHAGFAYGRVLGLPDVRFESYKRQLMKIAHPMPMIFDTLNAAKRWVYVFGATEASAMSFDKGINRFEDWRSDQYPEIADRAHIRTNEQSDTDIRLPLVSPHEALYDYTNPFDPENNSVLSLKGSYAEHMTPKQKIRLVRELARKGFRVDQKIGTFLTTL